MYEHGTPLAFVLCRLRCDGSYNNVFQWQQRQCWRRRREILVFSLLFSDGEYSLSPARQVLSLRVPSPHRDRRNVMTAVHLCWLLYTHLLVDLNSSVRDFVKGACFSFGDCLVSGSHAVDLGMTRELCVTSIAYSSFSFPTSVLL